MEKVPVGFIWAVDLARQVGFKEKQAREYKIFTKMLFKLMNNGIKDRQGWKRRQEIMVREMVEECPNG